MRRRWWGTLRVRVTTAAVVLLSVALIVSVVALAGFLRGTLVSEVEHHLDNQINEIVALAGRGQLPAAMAPTGRESGQIQVVAGDGRVVARSSGVAATARFDVLARPAPGARVAATVDGVKVDGDRGEQYRVVARAVETPSGPVVVYGVSTLRGADRAVHALWVASLVGLPTLVLLAGLFAWRAVRRALAPVDAMSAEVGEIEAHALDRRLAAPAGDDEFARLARTLNHMLDRLDTAVRLQRRFAADASHELRSPLTAARAQLEVGLAYPDRADWTTTAANVLDEIDRLERLAGELLDLARFNADSTADGAGLAPRRQRLDLAELVGREAASPEWRNLPLATATAPPPPVVMADPDLITRVVRNLLANAARHARSSVVVETGSSGAVAWVRVANDGPPVPVEHRERIFEPFARIDNARAARSGGAGLGLAIARRIARAHDGDLTLAPEAEGAAFLLTLPRQP
ncbi:MAG TPA: ATP-binding protein [Acidimicrobiia bacterium]|nr:ATP-binding protein [Acidimicrobiia bacterium]